MQSINGINWKVNNIPERLILKYKQNYKISYILSKVFLDKKYTEEEIHNSIKSVKNAKISYNCDDFPKAAKLFVETIQNKEKIMIFGDYDVDGYSSTFLMSDFLTNCKINSDYHIPNRFKDGYGPNINLLKKLLSKKKYDLFIFVDCATNSIEEINYLLNSNIKVIIIDHHQVYKTVNHKNLIVINPLKNKDKNNSSNFCATTLVYFFLKYLINKSLIEKKNHSFNKYLFFASMATICDQMPLRNFNKIIVKNGLNLFNTTNFKNLNNLINLKKKITSTDIGFILGPILNSSSRLGFSDLVIKLLKEQNIYSINKISKKLIFLNLKRKKIQNKAFQYLKNKIKISPTEVIFKYEKTLNEGIIGILAANFVEYYNKPSFILTKSKNEIKCSSRSIKGFNIGDIFNMALEKKIIKSGGGHSMAGGCILDLKKINEFNNFLNSIYKKKFINHENSKYYISEQSLDSLITFAKNEFQLLEPFGNDNFSPIFLIKKIKILKFKIINDYHLQLLIKNDLKKTCLCFAFNSVGSKIGEILMNSKKNLDLIVQINNKIVQKNSDFNLIIKDAIV